MAYAFEELSKMYDVILKVEEEFFALSLSRYIYPQKIL
jgi:hypothetical protein